MAANMYARSIFGEDALANLSIEKSPTNPESPVTGHIRIRAKSQVSFLTFSQHRVPFSSTILTVDLKSKENFPFFLKYFLKFSPDFLKVFT